ncbi:MAG: C4-dicarboxylate ABC transporter permease [Pseudooceanicola sp.]|nr:C4-dicarboxylate ABC transporter permease [Pseudooceanicola sp.]
MSAFDIGLLSLLAMGVAVMAGLFVPIALIVCSWFGVWAIKGSPLLASKLLALAANDAISSYFFGVVPLFVLMGFIVSEAGFGRDAFDVANAVFRRLRGGLGVGTVGANAIFAAITGISIASAAVFTKIAVPQMIRHGYGKRFAVGVVAGSSVLGMLIPPSLLLILFGILAEQSIGDLFLAGVGPGLLLALFFALGIVAMAIWWPGFVGTPDRDSDEGALSGGTMAAKGLPIAGLIVLVLGGIYAGFFTPVEAGAMGAIGALLLGFAMRRLTLARLWTVLVETGLVTATVCFLIIAAQMYSRMLALSGVPAGLGNLAANADLGLWGVMLIYVAIVVAMGMILDSSSIMLILVPLMLPVVIPMQVDLVWFGIVTVLAVEIGLLTPPFGISVYVIKATLDDPTITLGDIFRGAAPFAGIMLIVLALVLAFPAIATGLVPGR